MLENLRYFPGLFAFISTIIGLLNWSKLPNYKSKLTLFTIALTLFIEISGPLFSLWTGLLNYYIFNIYIFILFQLYFYILVKILKNYRCKILGSLFMIIYTICFILNLIFQLETLGHDIYSGLYSLGVFMFIILSTFYFIELFNSSNVLNYKKNIFFWFIIGVLLFHVPFLPFMLSLEWFLIEYISSIYLIVLFILNLIMNTCFIIGFLWTEKKYNY
ncbi:conserved membrane hypothetical protein [Flavobacterium sp. 9AF]|nr:conserved membrane hypothetical protein [Flavobacterium sp. 9AF]